MNSTYCWGILVMLEKWVPSEPSDSTKMEYKKTRLWSWWHSVAEGRPRQEQMAHGKSCEKEPDSNGALRSVELGTVNSSNNQKLLCRPINKIVLLVENEMVWFPTKETNKGQDDMITWGEPYVEALRKILLSKIKTSCRTDRLCMWPFANSKLWMWPI